MHRLGGRDKMTQLKALDGYANELLALRVSDAGPSRKRRDENRLMLRIADVLRPTVRKMTRQKGMIEVEEEVGQHAAIAIHNALGTWDGNISSFSTHVHWQLRAELRSLELQHFPERRKVCENIDVRMVHLNGPASEARGDESSEIGDVMNLDPEGYRAIEDNVDHGLVRRNIETAFARMVALKVAIFESEGSIEPAPVIQVMRDIHIFIQRHLAEESANIVAGRHLITRERIRQITNKIETNFAKNIRDIMQHPRAVTAEEQRAWQVAAGLYHEDCGHDIRLDKTLPLGDQTQAGGGSEEEVNSRTIVAAALVAAQPIAAQEHSRAIPPHSADAPVTAASEMPTAVDDDDDAFHASGRREWIIKIGEYPSKYALRSAADSAMRRHPELGARKVGVAPSRGGDALGLAFGTMDLEESTRLCTVLRQRGEECSRIRIRTR